MLSFSKNKLYNLILILTIILSIVLRAKTYLLGNPLWHDEASLAASILSRNSVFGFFTPLDYLQKAPPFFMSAVKFVTNILGTSEFALRLIPFLSSVGSIFLFYLLSEKILTKKSSIIFANALFAINYHLIQYSQEFKQYSTDIFLVFASLIILEKVELENLTYKKIFLYSLLSIVLILFSFPMLFVVLAFITLNLINASKETIKKLAIYTLPIGAIGFFYYFLILLPIRNLELIKYSDYWSSGFLSFNPNSFLSLIKANLTYYFNPNHLAIITILPILIGVYALIKENKKITRLLFLIILFATLGSLLHLYPIKERIGLYLLPIVLLLIAKPIDLFSKRTKVLTLTVIASFMFCFNQYNLDYLKIFYDKNVFKMQDSRTAMRIIYEKHKPSDIVIYNQASRSDYNYYSRYFYFAPGKDIVLIPSKYDKKLYFDIFNKLPKNKTYWFYFPFDYPKSPVIGFAQEWLHINHIKYKEEFHYERSLVLYVKL